MSTHKKSKYCAVCGDEIPRGRLSHRRKCCSVKCDKQLDAFLLHFITANQQITDSRSSDSSQRSDKTKILSELDDFLPLSGQYHQNNADADTTSLGKRVRFAATIAKVEANDELYGVEEVNSGEKKSNLPLPTDENTVIFPHPDEFENIENEEKSTTPLPEGVYLSDLPGWVEEQG